MQIPLYGISTQLRSFHFSDVNTANSTINMNPLVKKENTNAQFLLIRHAQKKAIGVEIFI